MVLPLGPGKFYGSSLPSPLIYTDVKLNEERVDPPVPVMDPFLSWAQEAHWSMGGLSFHRHRLQGRIEGNVDKLRRAREEVMLEQCVKNYELRWGTKKLVGDQKKRSGSASPPPPGAPKVEKKRGYVELVDEDDEEEEEVVVVEGKRRLARKLVGEFDKVAKESVGRSSGGGEVGIRTRSKGVEDPVMRVVEEVNREEGLVEGKKGDKKGKKSGVGVAMTLPRLAKKIS